MPGPAAKKAAAKKAAGAKKAGLARKSTPQIKPVWAPTFTDCMEQLQEAYVGAVASTAGCSMESISRDTYGMDVLIVQPQGPGVEELSIYAQLKNTTTVQPNPEATSFSYRFRHREHYVKLAVERQSIKAVLLVMVTDPDQSKWTKSSHVALSVVNCCYWANVEGHEVPQTPQPYVCVPTANIFSATALLAMFDRIKAGQRI